MKYAVPGVIALGTLVLTVLILPKHCSLLSNDVGPFVNCLQDVPQLCCRNYTGVFFARTVLVSGIALAAACAWYLWPKEDTKPVKIFE
jgi:hypothetical protein